MVRYGKFGIVPIQNDPLFYFIFIFIYLFERDIVEMHSLICIYYYTKLYMWCIQVQVYICCWISYLYVCFNPSSISPYPSSSLEFCYIFSICTLPAISQSRNLAILSCRDGPFYTATTIHLPIHPSMYVYGSNSSEMRSIPLTIQD